MANSLAISNVVSNVSVSWLGGGSLSASGGVLTMASVTLIAFGGLTMTGVNSITSAAGSALTLGTADTNQDLIFGPNGSGLARPMVASVTSLGSSTFPYKSIVLNNSTGVFFTAIQGGNTYTFESSGSGFQIKNGASNLISLGSSGTVTITAASASITTGADNTTLFGSSTARLNSGFFGPGGLRIGNGTSGPTITASGTSPNESLVFTIPGNGNLLFTAKNFGMDSSSLYPTTGGSGNLGSTSNLFANLFSQIATMTRAGIATTSTDAAVLSNTTASTSGVAVQYSPRLRFLSHAWNTTVTAADNYLEAIEELRPTSALVPTGTLAWAFRRSTDGSTGSFIDIMTLSSAGVMTFVNATDTAAFSPSITTGGNRNLFVSISGQGAYQFNQGSFTPQTGYTPTLGAAASPWSAGYFGPTGIATTSTDGAVVTNLTASTSGVAVQYSPRLRFTSQVWNTTVTAANNFMEFIQEVRPTSGTTPTGLMAWAARLSTAQSGSYTDVMTLSNTGTLAVTGLNEIGTNTEFILNNTTNAYAWNIQTSGTSRWRMHSNGTHDLNTSNTNWVLNGGIFGIGSAGGGPGASANGVGITQSGAATNVALSLANDTNSTSVAMAIISTHFNGTARGTTNQINLGVSTLSAGANNGFMTFSTAVAGTLTEIFRANTTSVLIASGKDLQLGNAFVATPQVATGYIIIKDSAGTSYKVSCNP